MRIEGRAVPGPRRRFDPLRDLPVVLWLLAALAIAVLNRAVPAPRWLMLHLLLLGAATHSILVWSQHFSDALLHNAVTSAQLRARTSRLGLLNAGVVLVVVDVPTPHWPLVVVGASMVAFVVGWHVLSLSLQLRRGLGSRFAVTIRYYIAASLLFPVGILFGVLMAHGLSMSWHERLMTAHVIVNVFGWLGITVLGTLVTLWPTMLRTRIAEGAERAARLALWLLVGGLAAAVVGCVLGQRPVVAIALFVYAAGLVVLARPFVIVMRAKPPMHFATWSVLAAVSWFGVLVATLGGQVAFAHDWESVHEYVGAIAPALAVGFGAQVLLGALSYLIPVSVGRGAAGARAANTVLDRGGALRITVVNVGLPLALFPVPHDVLMLLSGAVLAALASFLPLMFLAMRAARRARQAAAASPPGERPHQPLAPTAPRPRGQLGGLAVTGLAIVVVAVAVGVAIHPSALSGVVQRPADAGVTASGNTTRVTVRAADMRFSPSTVTVPVGNRLVITLDNADRQDVHDLVLDSGAHTPALAPGGSATLRVGVVGRAIEGWCSMPGHREMGMVLHIRVSGVAAPKGSAPKGSGSDPTSGSAMAPDAPSGSSAAAQLDFSARPGSGFIAHDPTLSPLPHGHVVRRTFTVSDLDAEVAPGVTQRLWVYDKSMPGPTLHARVGDRFVIRVVNDTDMGHSIDFHAGQVSPDAPMRTLAPGQSLTYRFTAHHAGIWLYHCSTMPMSAHIANGMFGAVVVDPPDLRPVAHSYVLVQSELYLGPQGGSVDVGKVQADQPDAVVFNGYADQYEADPLRVKTHQRVRIWVLDAGPNRSSAFHVVGGQFTTVFSEGAYLLRPHNAEQGAAQVLALGPAQGGFVEMTFPRAGHYPFVSHIMVDAERGARGIIDVTR